ncbi:hypothetical protein POG23_14965, partial [Limnoraphis robusta]|nr:hypothetical protein [Limnoraphis robusta]
MSSPSRKPPKPRQFKLSIALILLIGIVPIQRVYGTYSRELSPENHQLPLSDTLIATAFDVPDPQPPEDREGSGSRTSCPAVDKP